MSSTFEQAAQAWVDACKGESWLEREKASRALAEHDIEQLFEYFVNIVDVVDEFAARNAALVWLERNASDRIYEMYERLHESHNKLHLINLLGRIGDPKIASKLRPFLSDDDPNIISATIETLGQIGNPVALPWLGKFVDPEEPWYAIPSIQAVGAIGEAGTLALLQPALDDEDLAPIAIETMANLPGVGVVKALVEATGSTDPLARQSAYIALGQRWNMQPDLRPGLETKQLLSNTKMNIDAPSGHDDTRWIKGAFWVLQYADTERAATFLQEWDLDESWLSLLVHINRAVAKKVDLDAMWLATGVNSRMCAIEIARAARRLAEIGELALVDANESVRMGYARALDAAGPYTPSDQSERLLSALCADISESVRAVARRYFVSYGGDRLDLGLVLDFARVEIIEEVFGEFPQLATRERKQEIKAAADRFAKAGRKQAALRLLRTVGDAVEGRVQGWFDEAKNDVSERIDLIKALPENLSAETETWLLTEFRRADEQSQARIAERLAQGGDTDRLGTFWQECLNSGERPLQGLALKALGEESLRKLHDQLLQMSVSWDAMLRRELLLAFDRVGLTGGHLINQSITDPSWPLRATAYALADATMLSADQLREGLQDDAVGVRYAAANLLSGKRKYPEAPDLLDRAKTIVEQYKRLETF